MVPHLGPELYLVQYYCTLNFLWFRILLPNHARFSIMGQNLSGSLLLTREYFMVRHFFTEPYQVQCHCAEPFRFIFFSTELLMVLNRFPKLSKVQYCWTELLIVPYYHTELKMVPHELRNHKRVLQNSFFSFRVVMTRAF